MINRTTVTTLNLSFEIQQNQENHLLESHDPELEQAIQAASTHLEDVYITNARVSQYILKCISRKKWEKLAVLALTNAGIGNQGCKYLSQEQWCSRLTQLQLSHNHIESAGIIHLSKISFNSLIELWLMGNLIGIQGLKVLNKIKMSKLQVLNLNRNLLTLSEVIHLFLLSYKSINTVYIFDNKNLDAREYIISLAIEKFKETQDQAI